jgi:hypothetical protein
MASLYEQIVLVTMTQVRSERSHDFMTSFDPRYPFTAYSTVFPSDYLKRLIFQKLHDHICYVLLKKLW